MSPNSPNFLTPNVPIPHKFELLDRYWRASNYISVGQVSITTAEKGATKHGKHKNESVILAGLI
jgi:phosphoketolase